MPFVKAQPNEFLVTGQGGKIVNRGAAVSVYLWPGTSFVLIPSTQQEATFEMTQESKDGIPLRFKGIVVYRVMRPEATARMFDFCHPQSGHEQIKHLLGHICLGELRAHVSQLTMEECVEQRKTTLTDAVAAALRQTVSQGDGWGIELDVVQVAQVFIVDQELRRQLEAGVRNQIKSSSELSGIQMQEELRLARAQSDRKLLQETLETDQERHRVDRERLQMEMAAEQERLREQSQVDREKMAVEAQLEQERVRLRSASQTQQAEAEAPVRLLQIQKEKEILQQQLDMLRLQLQVRELEAEREMLLERRRQDLRKDILPLENVPVIADSVSRMFQGANLSFYGEASPLMSALGPALGMLNQSLAPLLKVATSNGKQELSHS